MNREEVLRNVFDWDTTQTPFSSVDPMTLSSILSAEYQATLERCPDLCDILSLSLHSASNHPYECLPSYLLRENCHDMLFINDDTDVLIFDTGASVNVSNSASDFISWDDDLSSLPTLQGISAKTNVEGSGIVQWSLVNDQGNIQSIRVPAYYVPGAKVRLLSPQRFIGEDPTRSLTMNRHEMKFHFNPSSSVTLTDGSNKKLPMVPLLVGDSKKTYALNTNLPKMDVLNPVNQNISVYEKEVLAWHYKLGHFHLPWIERLSRTRKGDSSPCIVVRSSRPKGTLKVMCKACKLSKASRTPEQVSIKQPIPEKEMALQRDVIRVGAKVSTDQFVSAVRGRQYHTQGKEGEGQKFTGGTIFIDISSGYMGINNQVSLKAFETINSKRRFEREMGLYGHIVQKYLGDNGVFRSREFQAELQKRQQTIEFCGVGAHHQNGVAERAIRTISDSARTMIIHAAIKWPEEVDISLWPMAVDYAVYLYNRMPGRLSDVAPIEQVSGQRLDLGELRMARVWGCPVYVLDPKRQDGKKLPRWVPRARKGQFVGRSRSHASTVGLIRNLKTGNISTQFHTVYDDYFTTVGATEENIALTNTWPHLFQFSYEDSIEGNENSESIPSLENEWLNENEIEKFNRERKLRLIPRHTTIPMPRHPSSIDPAPPSNDNDLEIRNNVQETKESDSDGEGNQNPEGAVRQNPRRKLRGINRRYHGEEFINMIGKERSEYLSESTNLTFLNMLEHLIEQSHRISIDLQTRNIETAMAYSIDEFNILHNWYPLYLASKVSSEDNPTLHQAMSSPERHGWIEAMEKELNSLEQMSVFIEVDRSEASQYNILDSTWAFKRKRLPDGSVRKLKARLCVRGDQQIAEIDFFETYAPVVQWGTVRMLLIIAIATGMVSKQVDYTNAFVHAPMENTVYVELPPLYGKQNKIWRLKKSLYGLRQSPLNFFQHLKRNLEHRKWRASAIDPCLFFKGQLICLVYVDDCLFFGNTMEAIDEEIKLLKEKKPDSFKLEEENDVAGFLGILMEKRENGKLELKQTGLIKRILDMMGLEDSTSKSTPAEKAPLKKDEFGPPCTEGWNYRSVVGMLMYLATNSRPDIAFAVNQCARFSNNPRRIHEVALKRIGRYLNGTKDNGMIIKPNKELRLDLYADADFAGLFTKEDAEDPTSVRSRAGWLVTLGDIPVIWKSKLMTEIALSTMEAEYMALSFGMRELIGNRQLIQEIQKHIDIPRNPISNVSRVFEDNEAALKQAGTTLPRLSPRTKHIGIKYHWFKSKIQVGEIELLPIDTKLQKADIFTKRLVTAEFEHKRNLVLGW